MPISSGMEIPAGLRSGGAGEQEEEQVERRLGEGGENMGRRWGECGRKVMRRGGTEDEQVKRRGLKGRKSVQKEVNEKVRGGEEKRPV